MLDDTAACEQRVDPLVAGRTQLQQFILHMQSRQVQASCRSRARGTEAVVILVVFLTRQTRTDIGGRKLK